MLHRFRTTAAGRPSGGAYEDLAVARYTQASCRLCRREGLKLFLKGERCYTDKCAIERRNYPPGEHGQARPKFSEYSIQLREKQKLRRIYGVLEAQFRRYFALADRTRGVTGETLLQLLERRLDNIVYRLGFSTSRAEARQLVRHGHLRANGSEVDEKSLTPTYGKFFGEPFERGYGTTIGNALRRVLLSSLQGAAIVGLRVKGVLHEFSTIPGVTEDVTDIVLNLKEVRVKLHDS